MTIPHRISRIIITMSLILSGIICRSEIYYGIDRFEVIGTAATDSTMRLSRLPDSMRQHVRPALWSLGNNTAGMALRFATDATTISAKWTSSRKTAMNHMCPTGIRGLDLYALTADGTWAFVGSARPNLSGPESTSTFVSNLPKKMREYMIFLSLYDGIDDIKIGLNPGAVLTKPSVDLPKTGAPIVMYGTSILQGGCATRPGMAHTNILQRKLNHEVVNLGFSGNGHLDPEIAVYMSEIPASMYVIDVLPNNTIKSINQKLVPFYNIIRKANPDTPILLVESPYYPRCAVDASYRSSIAATNARLHEIYMELKGNGDDNLYYFYGEDILDPDCEGSIDGVHFTDIGFTNFAENLAPVIKKIISGDDTPEDDPTSIFLRID